MQDNSGLFAGPANVASVRLQDYLEWIANPSHQWHGLFALPPIQRGPLWKPVQIVDLWDSLLRGMPFGSFLVARMHPGAAVRPLTLGQKDTSITQETKARFFLLDGQQRTLALLLGYCAHPHARLWLDLGQTGKQGRVFALCLTTTSQPFGFDSNDPTRKLSASQKRDARKVFIAASKDPDTYKDQYDHDFPLEDTRPWKAVLPVPLIDLWRAWRTYGRSSKSWWECTVSPHRIIEATCAKLEQVDLSIIDLLPRAFARLDAFELPLILVPDDVIDAPTGHQQEDAIETLYTRIGTGGTPLSGEEHIFSLLKHRWPQAHDVVDRLYGNENIGRLLKPTAIVMTTIRLVRAMRGEEDIPKPSVADFRRWLMGHDGAAKHVSVGNSQPIGEAQKPLLDALQGFVGETSWLTSPLQKVFERFRRLIDYRGAFDPGLPKVFMPYLDLPAIQVVLRWIDRHQGRDKTFFEANRGEVLRFLCFWHTAVHTPDRASKRAFHQVQEGEDFPGYALYHSLSAGENGEPLACRLPTPQTLRAALGQPTDHLRTWNERFGPEQRQDEERVAVEFLQHWWWQKDMLLWLQRQWVECWFAGYNPLAGQEEDTPYDYDHILPRAHLLNVDCSRFSSPGAHARFANLYHRNELCNAIGNYRVWPSAFNRGDGAQSPKTKLYLELETLPDYDWPKYLQTLGDLVAASAMHTADLASWVRASGNDGSPKQWDEERVKAFQAAVEYRVAWLYERFYHELNFASWER